MQKRRPLFLSLTVLLILSVIAIGCLLRGYQATRASHDLLLAIKAHQTTRALDDLRAHADPDFQGSPDAPPSFRTYLALLWNRIQGKTPSPGDPHQLTSPLALAVQENDATVVEALLAAGARKTEIESAINTYSGSTLYQKVPLILIAAQNKSVPMVQAFGKHGWDINEVDSYGQSALFAAGDVATTKALISQGIHLNTAKQGDWTALDFRVACADTAQIEALLEASAHDTYAMVLAIQLNHQSIVERFLNQNWDINARDGKTGRTPLLEALDTTETDPPQLHAASALVLLRRGADVHCRDLNGNTPLHLAAMGGGLPEMDSTAPQIVRRLLEQGAEVDAQNKEGRTPLMLATLHLRPELMQILLQHGAHTDLRTHTGATALALARRNFSSQTPDHRRAAIIRILKSAGAKK